MSREPTAREVLLNGSVWVAILALLAIVLTHGVIMDCMERDNWCDVIERGPNR